MKTKSFAFVVLRILALWILIHYVIVNVLLTVVGILEYYDKPNYQLDLLSYSTMMPLFLFVFWSIVCWFLWFRAEGLSKKLVISEIDENNLEAIDSEKMISVGLVVLGFYFIFNSIPDLISTLLYAYNYDPVITEQVKNRNLISIAKPIITLLIGLLCVIQTNTVKGFVNKLQKLGT